LPAPQNQASAIFSEIVKSAAAFRITGVGCQGCTPQTEKQKEIQYEDKLEISRADRRHVVPGNLWTST
jgi:hypothetical protein